MPNFPNVPSDENGNILRRMFENGDDLTKARMIDFYFVFSQRSMAIAFAAALEDQALMICISYYEKRAMWEVTVKRHMIPGHQEISTMEHSLTATAISFGGEADGWGCMQVDRSKEPE